MRDIFILAFIATCIAGIQLGMRIWRSHRLKHWLDLGMKAFKNEDYPKALISFRKCISLSPEFLHSRLLLSICLMKTGREEEALKEIELVKALHPKDGETWYMVCSFYAISMPHRREEFNLAYAHLNTLNAELARKFRENPAFAAYMNER